MANPDVVKQFGGKLLNIYTGGVLTVLSGVAGQQRRVLPGRRTAYSSAETRPRFVSSLLAAPDLVADLLRDPSVPDVEVM
jgi:hypothetical protein